MRTKIIITLLVIVVTVTATACGRLASETSAVSQSQQTRVAPPVSPNCEPKAVQDEQNVDRSVAHNPVRLVVMQDKSDSSNSTRTAQLTENDFSTPINLIRCTSGELSVGIVDDVSNRSLVRLRIDLPPTPPALPAASNVFERAEQDGEYQQRFKEYNDAFAKWQVATDKRVQAFLVQVGELLKQKPTAQHTNVWNAISRADLFLNESDATWPRPTHRWLLLNSDAVDTSKSRPVQMKSSARVLIVNGIGSIGSAGVADSLKPELLEALPAAFDLIAATELKGK